MEVYIHIPFCVRKCAYCDFLSFAADDELKSRYMDALVTEIRDFPHDPPVSAESVYIGGGTPSILPAEQIAGIMDAVREVFILDADAEISMEANPGTVTEEKLRVYRDSGINRLSFGCQSADDEELKALGRIHTWEQFTESFALARKAGFTNLNIDLMSGLPGQTEASWEKSLRSAAALSPEHISAYSLILEKGTPMYDRYDAQAALLEKGISEAELRKKISADRYLPDEETERRMYDRTAEILSEYGFRQYEISNYAKEGYACRHNIGYWTGVPYVGVGLGASSYMKTTRYRNTSDMALYLRDSSLGRKWESLNEKDLMAEFVILGLRMTEGFSRGEFLHRFGRDIDRVYGSVIDRYVKLGLLEEKNGRIRLTRQGISVSNTVMEDFLP
ncbi:MAG: radical SAM family heme chaperone HemW [Eubacteriales bacterium]|jgi:oxygen-independent coproporphyrinogen-3 oxidase